VIDLRDRLLVLQFIAMFARRTSLALAVIAFCATWAASAQRCAAINIVIDYSRDANFFFSTGNPNSQGATARAALEAAAAFYSNILTDTLDRIEAPPSFTGMSGDVVTWTWNATIADPATGANPTLNMTVLPANEYRIYVGARSLPDQTLGVAGHGTTGWTRTGGSFTSAEGAQIEQTQTAFENLLKTRGETSGFAAFGGSIAFDRDGSTTWHYNHTTTPAAGTTDFYSVALHELAHTLGIGAQGVWSNLATGSHFAGPAAAAAYGGPPPLQGFTPENPSPKHWAANTMSRTFSTNTVQEALLDPDLSLGARKHLTTLDAGGLIDLGWGIAMPNTADFNRDGTVNGPDLAAWRTAFKNTGNADADGDGDSDGRDFLLWQRRLGQSAVAASAPLGVPEPTAVMLLAVTSLMTHSFARRRRLRAAPSGLRAH
jgi:hypothetical protein